MAHWRQLIEKDHLGAWDLCGKDDKPRDYTLEIVKVESSLLKTREQPKGKRKCVISFRGAQKKFVCNTTNCETLESLYGSDPGGWLHKTITLYQTTTRNPKGGGTIPCIRVRPKAPTSKAEAIEPRPVDQEMREAQDAAFDRLPGED